MWLVSICGLRFGCDVGWLRVNCLCLQVGLVVLWYLVVGCFVVWWHWLVMCWLCFVLFSLVGV